MDGPTILVRTLSRASRQDSYGNLWQYHPQSDYHSRIACWGLLFDLLQYSSVLARHVAEGKVGFALRQEIGDARGGSEKKLDLVLCTPENAADVVFGLTLADVARNLGIDLTERERATLGQLPDIRCVSVASIRMAIEAKACVTEHVKALGRLHAELSSSQVAIHSSDHSVIGAALVMINIATQFRSPNLNKFLLGTGTPKMTTHGQPHAAERTVEKLRSVSLRTELTGKGYDVVGAILLDLVNDGSAVTLSQTPPAPQPTDVLHYHRFIHRLAELYDTRFENS